MRISTTPTGSTGEDVRIVSANLASDGTAVILFRRREDGPVEGLHIDLERFASLFDPRNAATLAKVIASDEIADPGGGEKRQEDWADGLVDYPKRFSGGSSSPVRVRLASARRLTRRAPL